MEYRHSPITVYVDVNSLKFKKTGVFFFRRVLSISCIMIFSGCVLNKNISNIWQPTDLDK